jgi:hypothetical protein
MPLLMADKESQITSRQVLSEIQRLEEILANHLVLGTEAQQREQAAREERALHERAAIEAETRLKIARERLAGMDVEADEDGVDLQDQAMRIAAVTGEITIALFRAHYPARPMHQLERTLKALAAAGRLRVDDDGTKPVRGSPRVYRITGSESDTGRHDLRAAEAVAEYTRGTTKKSKSGAKP